MRPDKLEYAKKLRRRMTNAEKILWKAIRNRQLRGIKFKRQMPIGPYIVDFYCPEYKVIFEIDGEIHKQREEYDLQRTMELMELGYKVLRIRNERIEQSLEEALVFITRALKE